MDKTLQAKRGRKTEDEEGRKGGWEEGIGEGRRGRGREKDHIFWLGKEKEGLRKSSWSSGL